MYDSNMNKVPIKEQYAPQPSRAAAPPRVIRENFSMKSKKSWLWILLIALAIVAIFVGVYMMRKGKKEGMALPVPMQYGKQKFGFRFY